jgi:soluble lytic murein transglycosylase-like protein
MLSALAGGGLTAAGLGGPLTGGALGALPAGTPTSTDESSTPTVVPNSGASGKQEATGQPPTTTSTTPASTSSAPQVSTPESGSQAPAVPEAPSVVVQHKQKPAAAKPVSRSLTPTHPQPKGGAQPAAGAKAPKSGAASGPNNVALPPQLVASQAGALTAALAGSVASAQALAFYRIPPFLLPIYEAAAVQYGVPWQILAAVNEIETNYGADQAVSTAGAVGWMQFMPATWMQYGVDALNAGYADPYNPVDAIFAAARYLSAAGAASDLRKAVLAYNHSDEYVSSVLLRAKLISSYPKSVISTLTGLINDRLPVSGRRIAWGAPAPASSSASTATANATAVAGQPAAGSNGASRQPSAAPGSALPPSLSAAAAVAAGKTGTSAQALQLVDVTSAPNAVAVAVQDGRIVRLGSSRTLGRYVILRDVYGDVFTYAGLGSIAPSYRLPKPAATSAVTSALAAASGNAPKPSQPATGGRQLPLTVRVKTPARQSGPRTGAAGSGEAFIPTSSAESTPAGMGKVRLFAHPGNPDARAATASAAGSAHQTDPNRPLPLRQGSVVAKGTVLGHVRMAPAAKDGHMRFAIRPAGDASTIDPRPILANWVQLDAALHPQGAKGEPGLLGATASDVFLFSKGQLEREILSDPGIAASACSRHQVASGAIDKRVLAAIAFLSRSGLKPMVGALRCDGAYAVSGYVPVAHIGDAVAISQINGVPITGHQGTGSITDTTIRTLLTLQGEFVPRQIVSLMQYPGAPSTLARPDHGDYIEIAFSPPLKRATTPKATATPAAVVHSAGAGQAAPSPQTAPSPQAAPSPLVVSGELTPAQWDQLLSRIAALPAPTVARKPSSSAIPDHAGK